MYMHTIPTSHLPPPKKIFMKAHFRAENRADSAGPTNCQIRKLRRVFSAWRALTDWTMHPDEAWITLHYD